MRRREIVSLLDAHRRGYTHEEEERLRAPLAPLSPKNLRFAFMKLAMRTLGRLSEGMRLGADTGFDSGSTLDYVYRNRAAGTTPLGRLIDRNYLDSIGWRGIRVRKQHVECAIADAAQRLQARVDRCASSTSLRGMDATCWRPWTSLPRGPTPSCCATTAT